MCNVVLIQDTKWSSCAQKQLKTFIQCKQCVKDKFLYPYYQIYKESPEPKTSLELQGLSFKTEKSPLSTRKQLKVISLITTLKDIFYYYYMKLYENKNYLIY